MLTVLAAVVLASPFLGLPGDRAHAANTKPTPADPIEARIKALHRSLHITTVQEPLWSNFAQVMRENAKAMEDQLKEVAQNAQSITGAEPEFEQILMSAGGCLPSSRPSGWSHCG